MFLWRTLLCLPENYTAYSSLMDKGPHSAFLTLPNKYPIKSHKLQRCLLRYAFPSFRHRLTCLYDICSSNLPFPALLRVLSALAHWAAIFGEVDYLPLVAFPFVKLFQNNPLLCFEMLATVIGAQQMIVIAKKDVYVICAVAYCIVMSCSVCGSSKLVSTLVRVLPQPTFEYPGHGGECSGSP